MFCPPSAVGRLEKGITSHYTQKAQNIITIKVLKMEVN
jgi:hypothetical protein